MDNQRFRMRKLALLIAACYAPGAMAAQAARIEFATSEPVIVSTDGRERPARKGEAIIAGERVLTRAGRAQLAFTDGAFVSLQPNTDFGVTEYNFTGKDDGSEKSVLSLVRGALRTVTGLIGRSRRDAYVMRTPSATIGIRGTGGRIEVNDRGTFVSGTSGTWFVSTPGGSVDIPAGSNGFAGPNPQDPPQRTSTGPSTPPVSAPLAGFVAPDQVNSTGKAQVAPPAPATAPAPAPTMADGAGYSINYVIGSAPVVSASSNTTFASGIGLSTHIESAYTQSVGTATIYENNNDGTIGWGRWANGTVSRFGGPVTLTQDKGFHYVVGVPTASMPSDGELTYTKIGSTNPTLTDGSSIPGSIIDANTSLTVNLNGGASTLSFSVGASVGGQNFIAGNTNIPISGATASASFVQGDYLTSGSACGSSGCTGSVRILFTGSAAERAGLTFSLTDSLLGKTAVGAVIFKK